MELKLLKEEELIDLYNGEMTNDFPKSELKPVKAMVALLRQGVYEPLLAVQDGEPMGYAMVWLAPQGQGALLEYLGVMRGKRNSGLGGEILELLAQRYSQIFGEAEAPTSLDEGENQLRRRRIGFYQRHGFRVLGYDCALFGVHFKCLYRGQEEDDGKIQTLHRSVYASYFSPPHMERYFQIPLNPGEPIHPAPSWLEEQELDEE